MPTATPWPLVLVLGLAACGPAEPPPPPAAAAGPPPPAAGPGFVGRWAAEPSLCASGAWVFEAARVTTAGEVSCAFRKVEPTAAGYRVDAVCASEGAEAPSEFALSMTDPAPPQAMTVTGGPWSGPITLRRCPG